LTPFNPPEASDATKRRALWGLAILLAVLGLAQAWALLRFQPAGLDFLPLWTAGRMAWSGHVYDFAAITHAQAWLLPNFPWPRPYAYPPTTLLLLAPLGALPFWPALGLWMALGFGVFLYAGTRLAPGRRALVVALLLLSPSVVLAAVVDQAVVLVGGLTVLAMVDLDGRPRRAGVWLALAAVIKPQAVLLAPLALVAGGAFEALVSTAVVVAALVGLSVAVFGFPLWTQWLASLPGFQKAIESVPNLMAGVITPLGAANLLGLAGPAAIAWRAAFALLGAGLAWTTFARRADPATRLAALAAGSLLIAPYAMAYDGAMLVPAAVAIALGRLETRGWAIGFLGLAAVCEVTTPDLGLVAVAAFALISSGVALRLGAPRPLPAPTLGG
jgi:hypothetical protein